MSKPTVLDAPRALPRPVSPAPSRVQPVPVHWSLTLEPQTSQVFGSHCQVSSLAPLAGKKHLRLLRIAQTPVTDLSPLATCDELEVVDIDSAHMIYWEQPEAAAAEIRRFLS